VEWRTGITLGVQICPVPTLPPLRCQPMGHVVQGLCLPPGLSLWNGLTTKETHWALLRVQFQIFCPPLEPLASPPLLEWCPLPFPNITIEIVVNTGLAF
jgi:hypothetical protein